MADEKVKLRNAQKLAEQAEQAARDAEKKAEVSTELAKTKMAKEAAKKAKQAAKKAEEAANEQQRMVNLAVEAKEEAMRDSQQQKNAAEQAEQKAKRFEQAAQEAEEKANRAAQELTEQTQKTKELEELNKEAMMQRQEADASAQAAQEALAAAEELNKETLRNLEMTQLHVETLEERAIQLTPEQIQEQSERKAEAAQNAKVAMAKAQLVAQQNAAARIRRAYELYKRRASEARAREQNSNKNAELVQKEVDDLKTVADGTTLDKRATELVEEFTDQLEKDVERMHTRTVELEASTLRQLQLLEAQEEEVEGLEEFLRSTEEEFEATKRRKSIEDQGAAVLEDFVTRDESELERQKTTAEESTQYGTTPRDTPEQRADQEAATRARAKALAEEAKTKVEGRGLFEVLRGVLASDMEDLSREDQLNKQQQALDNAGRQGGGSSYKHKQAARLETPNQILYSCDPFVQYTIARGLVGQRGPQNRAVDSTDHPGIANADRILNYLLPSPASMAAIVPYLRKILDDTASAPSLSEVTAALAEARSTAMCEATHDEVLSAFEGNFALVGAMPVARDDARGGLEEPHAVRWMPSAHEHGEVAAKVAVMEHLSARCSQLADATLTSSAMKASLRSAAVSFKLAQMEPLYMLREAVAYQGNIGTEAPSEALVTRPCAHVRGQLAFPIGDSLAMASGCRVASNPVGDSSEAKAAMRTHSISTSAIRAEARANGKVASQFAGPPPLELAYVGSSTGTMLFDSSDELDVAESVTPHDFSVAQWLRIVERAAVTLHYMNGLGGHFQSFVNSSIEESGRVTAETRRDGLWTEFRRHVGISQDRLWIFLRLVSGVIGADVTEILTAADESAVRAAKDLQTQRLEVAKKVADTQAKIMDTVIGSLAKTSSLALDTSEQTLVIVNSDVQKQLNELVSGNSGRPLYEANVALRVAQSIEPQKMPLYKLLSSISVIGASMQRSMENSLTSSSGASLAELSHPCNSYFVSVKEDAVAAIRVAHEVLNVELAMRGCRRVQLWEVVEGGCQMLITRFASFVAYSLVQARSSTGTSAMYVSHTSMATNAALARGALSKLLTAATVYSHRVPTPTFENEDDRDTAMEQGSAVEEVDVVGSVPRRGNSQRQTLHAPIPPSGWYIR